MNISKVMMLVSLLFVGISASPEVDTIQMQEVPQADAPVRVTGYVTWKDNPSESVRYSFDSDLHVINQSPKPVLLMIVELKVVSKVRIRFKYTEVDDYFFEPGIPAPGDSVNLHRV